MLGDNSRADDDQERKRYKSPPPPVAPDDDEDEFEDDGIEEEEKEKVQEEEEKEKQKVKQRLHCTNRGIWEIIWSSCICKWWFHSTLINEKTHLLDFFHLVGSSNSGHL